MQSCPWMNYQRRPERQDICIIDITSQFMLALTYSNLALCQAQHNVVEIADDAKNGVPLRTKSPKRVHKILNAHK